MTKYFKLFIVVIALTITQNCSSQNDTTAIQEIISTLFDGMRESDSTKVKSALHKNCILLTSYFDKRDNKNKIHQGSVEEFINAVGEKHDEIWDERISNLKISVDGTVAQAWMNYSFYLGINFSHCGVNSMEFVKENEQWTIRYISDTRRKTNCE